MLRRISSSGGRGRRLAKAPAIAAVTALLLMFAGPLRAEDEFELLGPLRIRDMTPFNILRLDMLPAHALMTRPGSWAVEADLAYTNTFIMSENVRSDLEKRGVRGPLTQADAEALQSLGEDAYYVDGEFGLLDLTMHYAVTQRTSVYFTLPAYSFSGGFLDGTIEGFHKAIGNGADGRDLVARDQFQSIVSIQGLRSSFLEAPTDGGLGDPVIGVRRAWGFIDSRSGVVLEAAAKLALRGERSFLSTGSNDLGLQASWQRRFRRQGVYLGAGFVWTDGRVLGVDLGRRIIPTLTGAYELGLSARTNFILQMSASESALRDTGIEELRANKYQASLGLRTRAGNIVYGMAVTENVANFENTPDIGASVSLIWLSSPP